MQSCLFVGVDTHKHSHTAAAFSSYFNLLATITFANSYQGFNKLLEQLEKLSNGKILIFGLEDSQGLGNFLAEFLLKKGFDVVDIDPVLTDRGRRRTTHKDKSDDRDACLIAKTLISKKDSLHKVTINKTSLALRELVKSRELLVGESTRIKNRLHVLIFNQYMDISGIFSDLFSKCALAFFARYPDPSKLKGESLDSLESFLKSNSKGRHGKKKAMDMLSLASTNNMPDILTDVRSSIIKKHIKRLSAIQEELKDISDMLSELILKSSYITLTSIPGINIVTAAKIISQVIDIGRFSSSSKLAKFIGVAPVEKSSGRKIRYQKSKHGKRYLYSAIYYIALNHISRTRDGRDNNQISRAYYLKKISEGKTKKEAITCLARRLTDVIYAIMRDGSIYSFLKVKSVRDNCEILETVAS
ncbi:MAG: IS110 family RNA-guided transposase [Candidatus Humimicrobiaceae bacterium]